MGFVTNPNPKSSTFIMRCLLKGRLMLGVSELGVMDAIAWVRLTQGGGFRNSIQKGFLRVSKSDMHE